METELSPGLKASQTKGKRVERLAAIKAHMTQGHKLSPKSVAFWKAYSQEPKEGEYQG